MAERSTFDITNDLRLAAVDRERTRGPVRGLMREAADKLDGLIEDLAIAENARDRARDVADERSRLLATAQREADLWWRRSEKQVDVIADRDLRIEQLSAALAGAEQATTDARRELAEARETIDAADAYIKGRNELGDQTHAAVLRINADLTAVRNMLADCVVKATEYGTQDGDFVAMYLLPTGPIHRAIPYLDGVGINVRPGFDGRTPVAGTTSTDRPSNRTIEGIEPCLCPPSPRSSSKSACKHSPRPTSSQETEPPSRSSRPPKLSPSGSSASSLTPTALPESDAAAPQYQGAADVPAAQDSRRNDPRFEDLLAAPDGQHDLASELLPHLIAFGPTDLPQDTVGIAPSPIAQPWLFEDVANTTVAGPQQALAADVPAAADARRELASVTDQRDRLRNKLLPKGFGRWNQHCMSCGDERGGPFGHETSECRYKPGMTAAEVAELLPEHRLAEFWELCVERYLTLELETRGEALAADVPAAADDCPICTHALSGHRSNIIPGTETKALRCDICGPCDGPDAAADHEHPGGYLSTACLHGLCEPECGAAQRARGYIGHPTCKYCKAKCTHSCHAGGQVERAERVHVDGCTLAADDPHHAGWCGLAGGETARPGDMGVVDAIDQWYGVTDAGRTLHVVVGPVTVGVLAVCGQRVVREASPLDSTRLCRRCVRLTDVPAAGEARKRLARRGWRVLPNADQGGRLMDACPRHPAPVASGAADDTSTDRGETS